MYKTTVTFKGGETWTNVSPHRILTSVLIAINDNSHMFVLVPEFGWVAKRDEILCVTDEIK